MKTIMGFGMVFCLVVAFSSCAKLLPINYDKAGRDVMAILQNDASLTISDYRSRLSETGMSSKDFFTVLKMDGSIYEFTQLLSLDMVNTKMKEMGVDIKNLKRALEE
jgi:hypothetical protein